jgi:hypothetical protein
LTTSLSRFLASCNCQSTATPHLRQQDLLARPAVRRQVASRRGRSRSTASSIGARAVDADGFVLDALVQGREGRRAAPGDSDRGQPRSPFGRRSAS